MTSYLLFQALIFLRRTLKILALKHVAFCSTTLAQAWCSAGQRLILLELLHQMTPYVAILFPFIIFLLILIFLFLFLFCLKSLPPQESTWPLLGSGTVWSGILPLFGVLLVSTMQFFTECWCIENSSNDPWFLSVTLRAPGEVPHIQSQGRVFFVSSNSDCMWYGPILVLTTGCSHLHFYFLCCEGALSCPHLSQEMFITWSCLDRKRTKLPSLVFRT